MAAPTGLLSGGSPREANVGWVERSDTHRPRSDLPMGIAFGSTHPTLAAMAFREEHRGHGRSHESACGSGLVPDAVPGCLPHRTEVALQVKLSRRRNRLHAVPFTPRPRLAEKVVRVHPPKGK